MKERIKQFSLSLVLGLLTAGLFYSGACAQEVVIGFTGPLSGPGSGYGRDNFNGLKMACEDINAAGGLTVDGINYTFRLEAYDDMIDPALAVNNARRLRARSDACVIFNPVFNTIAPLMEINEQRGSEFLLMAYSSIPRIDELDNDLTCSIPPPSTAFVRAFSDLAWEKGWRKGAMVVTLGAYGNEWRKAFREHWVDELGGQIVADKPANYYTDTNFSAQLKAALATEPDFLLIGGPSEPTGLVIEQARNLGFEGGFILADQAKMDYIADIVFDGDLSLMEDTIGIAPCLAVPSPVVESFDKRYEEKFGVHNTFEAMLEYSALNIVFSAIKEAGTATDPWAIKAAMPAVLPQDATKIPTVYVGALDTRLLVPGTIACIDDGKYSEAYQYAWWPRDEKAFKKYRKQLPGGEGVSTRWKPIEGYLTD